MSNTFSQKGLPVGGRGPEQRAIAPLPAPDPVTSPSLPVPTTAPTQTVIYHPVSESAPHFHRGRLIPDTNFPQPVATASSAEIPQPANLPSQQIPESFVGEPSSPASVSADSPPIDPPNNSDKLASGDDEPILPTTPNDVKWETWHKGSVTVVNNPKEPLGKLQKYTIVIHLTLSL